jgi:hypothetical protein
MFNNCSKCGEPLEDVFKEENHQRRKTDFPQKKDALVLEIHTGYGMFFDEPRTAFILCHSCILIFLKDNPWITTGLRLYAGNVYYER